MFTHEDHHHHHLHQHHHLFQFPPNRPILMDRRWKQPNIDLAPNCPRCDSSNTKFCYYNNYSLTQPRYFCKGCRRYWTKGGSLRNVPVGGGCRKNRRGKSVRISSSNNRNSSPPGAGYGGSNSAPVSRDDISPIADNITSARSDSSSSTIDLALVYAKFLNPHQQPAPDSSSDHPRVSMPEMPPSTDRIFESSSSFEYSSTISEPSILQPHVNPIHHRFASSSSLSQDHQQCIINRLSSSDPSPEIEGSTQQQQVLLGEVVDLNSYKLQESRLIIPPQFTSLEPNSTSYLLPSTEEVVLDQDHLWLNSPTLGANSTYPWHQTTEEEPFEPMVVDHNHSTFHSNPMDSNWSSFDLPTYEAFPRQ